MFWYPREADLSGKDDKGQSLEEFLDGYDPRKYELPAVTTDILVFVRSEPFPRLLLVRRGRHPYYGMLALPGGFLEMKETLDQGAARELMEETGVTGVPLQQLGAYGTLGRDPRLRIVSVAYTVVLDKEPAFQAGDDAADAAFCNLVVSKQENNGILQYHMEATHPARAMNAWADIEEQNGQRTIVRSTIASDHALMVLDAVEKLGFAIEPA